MQIRVINPASSVRPNDVVPPDRVKEFLERGGAKNKLVLEITPSEGSSLRITEGEAGNPLSLDSETSLDSISVSAHADFRGLPGLVHFGIREE